MANKAPTKLQTLTQNLVKRICDYAKGMTPWEVDFVEAIAKNIDEGRWPSEAQVKILERIDNTRVR